jgi:hypothetical protein
MNEDHVHIAKPCPTCDSYGILNPIEADNGEPAAPCLDCNGTGTMPLAKELTDVGNELKDMLSEYHDSECLGEDDCDVCALLEKWDDLVMQKEDKS